MLLSFFIVGLIACYNVFELKLLILLEVLILSSITIFLSDSLFTDFFITNLLVLGACETSIGLCLILHLYHNRY